MAKFHWVIQYLKTQLKSLER